jgi:hypothetical protein
MIPILWIDKHFTIGPETAKSIGFVTRLRVIGKYFFAGITLLGIMLLVCSFLQILLAYKQARLKER